jgi:hypothetical protein
MVTKKIMVEYFILHAVQDLILFPLFFKSVFPVVLKNKSPCLYFVYTRTVIFSIYFLYLVWHPVSIFLWGWDQKGCMMNSKHGKHKYRTSLLCLRQKWNTNICIDNVYTVFQSIKFFSSWTGWWKQYKVCNLILNDQSIHAKFSN